MDWREFLGALSLFPPEVNSLNPPCPQQFIETIENSLGALPIDVHEMLAHMNGGELFIDAIPMLTLFGVSTPDSPIPEAIDLLAQTNRWRQANPGSVDWLVGVSNYGGYYVVRPPFSAIHEWDSSRSQWSDKTWSFAEFRACLLLEGPDYLAAQ